MRVRLPFSVATLALALGALLWLPSGSQADVAPPGSTAPMWALGIARTASDGPGTDPPGTDPPGTGDLGTDDTAGEGSADEATVDGSATDEGGETGTAIGHLLGLSLEETRKQVNETEVAFRVIRLQKETDDRNLAEARSAVGELRDETHQIAESTVDNAISSYRQLGADPGLLQVEDLNEGLRANALSDAAIVADTKTFDQYRDKAKDLQLAEVNLEAEIDENQLLSAEVSDMQNRLQAEQSWWADLEERQIQNNARTESITESGWAQALGTKQGFYLRTCPVAGPHNFIDSWGFPRSGGRRHKGVDMLARTGVPIVAPANGTVTYRSNSVGGRSFHLVDENGNYYYGTHMSAYGDVEGEVRAGQVIGYVGDDGNAAGIPHLHFEIHAGGRGNAINPFTDVAAVCDGARY